jgi:SSS family solute:Na+ symporter
VGSGVEFWVFCVLFGAVIVLGFWAARWRRPTGPYDLEEWGVGGRAFGNWVTWFLMGGSSYTAYTFIAVPALVYAVGANGFFAIPFALITAPLAYVVSTRFWSVSHRHGFITPTEFVRARFGSRTLALLVAIVGIVATMPYIAVQLMALQAVFKVLGITGDWPIVVALGLLAFCTFRSGLRAPALLSIAKDVLLVWVILAAVLVVAMSGGWHQVFKASGAHFSQIPGTGLLLGPHDQLSYVTLVIGSALSIFVYPHALTGILAAKDRSTVQRNAAALPVYTVALGLMALLGLFALSQGVLPLGYNPAKGQTGDLNTIIPQMFHQDFPPWCAGIAFAGLGVAALVPAAVMSISAANLFTRSIYREYLRPDASQMAEARVSRWASLLVKLGAAGFIVLLDPSFSVNLQLIGGVLILQVLPAVILGLYLAWFHRAALIAGLLAGLAVGIAQLYQIQEVALGRVTKAHFGGASWPLSHLGLHTSSSIYAGLSALAVNLVVATLGTMVLRLAGARPGQDSTRPADYLADADDRNLQRLDDLIEGQNVEGVHAGVR